MDIVNIFAYNLKKFRKIRGFSQVELSNKSGLHRTYISAIERRKRSISLDNVQKLADALTIETYMLFIPFDEEKEVTREENSK